MNLNKIYCVNDDFEKKEYEDSIVYSNFMEATWIRTDAIGDNIIMNCNGDKTISSIINEVAGQYGMPSEIIQKNCEEFFEKILDTRLIYPEDEEKYLISEKKEETKYPISIWIHVTGKCNLNCDFCYSKSGAANNSSLKLEEIKNFLEQIPEEHRKEIVISGGEPFIYDNIVELIKELKCSLKFEKIRMITNGTVGHDKYEEVSEYIDSIQFSVDGPNQEIHDISRGAGSFNKMMLGIQEAKKSNFKLIMISFTPTVKNYKYLKEMPRFAYDNKIKRIHITKLMPVGRGVNSKKELSLTLKEFNEELEKFYEEYLKVMRVVRDNREIKEIGKEESEKTQYIEVSMAGDFTLRVKMKGRIKSCGAGDGLISINYDGGIYPCPSLHLKQYKMGSIGDKTEDILDRGRNFGFLLSVENTESDCYECKYKYFCGGGCKARALDMNGVNNSNEECSEHKNIIDALMRTLEVN